MISATLHTFFWYCLSQKKKSTYKNLSFPSKDLHLKHKTFKEKVKYNYRVFTYMYTCLLDLKPAVLRSHDTLQQPLLVNIEYGLMNLCTQLLIKHQCWFSNRLPGCTDTQLFLSVYSSTCRHPWMHCTCEFLGNPPRLALSQYRQLHSAGKLSWSAITDRWQAGW